MCVLKNMDNEKGFTIVELFVYLAILLVVIGALYSILTTNTRSYSSQENKVAMVQGQIADAKVERKEKKFIAESVVLLLMTETFL